jgi:hypothetical protein
MQVTRHQSPVPEIPLAHNRRAAAQIFYAAEVPTPENAGTSIKL